MSKYKEAMLERLISIIDEATSAKEDIDINDDDCFVRLYSKICHINALSDINDLISDHKRSYKKIK